MKCHPILKNRRRFDETFKQQAVRTLLESGRSVTAMAAILGVDRTNLQKWKKQFAPLLARKPPAGGEMPVGASEFHLLKKEFEAVKETVSQLRNVVYKTLTDKYGNGR